MKYKIAETPEDWGAVKRLLLAEGFDDQELGFPTIMAIDNETLVGFIATTPRTDMILGGPMVMKHDKRRVFTAVRLVELYEQTMRSLGITSVVFYADEESSPFVRGIRKWFPGVTPYKKEGSLLFYNWRLTENPRRSA